jgi:hypothetical protein
MRDARNISDVVRSFSSSKHHNGDTEFAIARGLRQRDFSLEKITSFLHSDAHSFTNKIALALFEGASASYEEIASCLSHINTNHYDIAEALEHIEQKHPSGEDNSTNYTRIAKAMHLSLSLTTTKLAEAVYYGSKQSTVTDVIRAMKKHSGAQNSSIMRIMKGFNLEYKDIVKAFYDCGTKLPTIIRDLKLASKKEAFTIVSIVAPLYNKDYNTLATDSKSSIGATDLDLARGLNKVNASYKNIAKALYLSSTSEQVAIALKQGTNASYNEIASLLRNDFKQSYTTVATSLTASQASPEKVIYALVHCGCKRVKSVLNNAHISIPSDYNSILNKAYTKSKSKAIIRQAAVETFLEQFDLQNNNLGCIN